MPQCNLARDKIMKTIYVAYKQGKPIGFSADRQHCINNVSTYISMVDDWVMDTDACIEEVNNEEVLKQIITMLFIEEYKDMRKQGFPPKGAIEWARMSRQCGFLYFA